MYGPMETGRRRMMTCELCGASVIISEKNPRPRCRNKVFCGNRQARRNHCRYCQQGISMDEEVCRRCEPLAELDTLAILMKIDPATDTPEYE